jgi:hypothetical protein
LSLVLGFNPLKTASSAGRIDGWKQFIAEEEMGSSPLPLRRAATATFRQMFRLDADNRETFLALFPSRMNYTPITLSSKKYYI